MRRADTVRLVLLAAIWGASFLFNRITAPVLGPVLTAELRTLIAGIALASYFGFAGFNPEWRRWGRQYVIVGILTSALPFLLRSICRALGNRSQRRDRASSGGKPPA